MLLELHHQSVIGFGCFLLFRQKALHQHRRGVCTSLFPAGCLSRTRVQRSGRGRRWNNWDELHLRLFGQRSTHRRGRPRRDAGRQSASTEEAPDYQGDSQKRSPTLPRSSQITLSYSPINHEKTPPIRRPLLRIHHHNLRYKYRHVAHADALYRQPVSRHEPRCP